MIERVAVHGNELLWLSGDGPGAHTREPTDADDVARSLRGSFSFIEESETAAGLRTPQLGALHSILAYRSTEEPGPITVVMPTGTGKTETMLAAYCHSTLRTLVVVPSDALRIQIADKFATLGVLPLVGAVSGDFRCPTVLVLTSGLSWRSVADLFANREVVQFTATPYREDGKHLGGRIAYAYPLRLAQKHGYFAQINYHSVIDLAHPDQAVATAAIAQLRKDLEAGKDHLLMARVRSVDRAKEVLQFYEELAADLHPIRIDTGLAESTRRKHRDRLISGESKVVVCVNMLGEGFDLPALKIAAIHDPQRSLAVTLRFIGRFTRVGDASLGDASAFVPLQVAGIDERLRRLYGGRRLERGNPRPHRARDRTRKGADRLRAGIWVATPRGRNPQHPPKDEHCHLSVAGRAYVDTGEHL